MITLLYIYKHFSVIIIIVVVVVVIVLNTAMVITKLTFMNSKH